MMKTKASLPHSLLANQKVSAIVEVYFEINHLKQLYRQGWLQRNIPYQNCESVAEHSFCVALLALFVAESYSPELDKWKVICMALLHDLGEIHVGDFTPLDHVERAEKQRLERLSIEAVLSKLPNGSTYMALWEEYEAGISPEACFVREIDRLEMGLQASVYEHQNLVDPKSFFASAEKVLYGSKLLRVLKELETLKPCEDLKQDDNQAT